MTTKQIARWLRESRSAVVFTGAGVSTESGIPDFRSPGGVWATSQPVYFDDFVRSHASRTEYWRQKSASHHDFFDAQPNVAHRTFAAWEAAGIVRGVVTQNIDGLHQLAGSRSVLELHGTAREVGCLDCDARFDAGLYVELFEETGTPPICPDCGGNLKHATISFGQQLPADVLQEAVAWSREADLFFAVGSSLVVEPAASLPRIAADNGAKLVIVNRDATPLDFYAKAVVHAAIGETFAAIADELNASKP